MTEVRIINVGKDFSSLPQGRFEADGPTSGQLFRTRHLVPALLSYNVVYVELDYAIGYPCSWLDEAFGGLVRHHGLTKDQIFQRLIIVTGDFALMEEVWGYINSAEPATAIEAMEAMAGAAAGVTNLKVSNDIKNGWRSTVARLRANDSVVRSVASPLADLMFEHLVTGLPYFLWKEAQLDLTIDTDDGTIVLDFNYRSIGYLVYRSLNTGNLHVSWHRPGISGILHYSWDNDKHNWPLQFVTGLQLGEPVYMMATNVVTKGPTDNSDLYMVANRLLYHTCTVTV